MSLINEALKRVRLSRKPPEGEVPPETPEPPEPPLEPVEGDPSPKRSSKLLVPLCVLLAVCGIWFLWKWWSDSGVTPKAGPIQASVPAKPNIPATPETGDPSKTAASDSAETVEPVEPADTGPVTQRRLLRLSAASRPNRWCIPTLWRLPLPKSLMRLRRYPSRLWLQWWRRWKQKCPNQNRCLTCSRRGRSIFRRSSSRESFSGCTIHRCSSTTERCLSGARWTE